MNLQHNINSTDQLSFNADYLDEPVSVAQFNYNISGFQSFTLPKNYGIEISGLFQSPSLFGISKTNAFGLLNAGIKRNL